MDALRAPALVARTPVGMDDLHPLVRSAPALSMYSGLEGKALVVIGITPDVLAQCAHLPGGIEE